MKEKKLVSLVVYLNNNENTIAPFLEKITQTVDDYFEKFELIIVNDFSVDNSVKVIRQLDFLKNHQVSIIQMSFHQGLELSMNAGIDLSSGDFVYEFDSVIIDYELDLIIKAYKKLLQEFDIVTISPTNSNSLNSKLFYLTYNYFSKSEFKLKTDRFRVLSRRAINRSFSISATIPYRKAMYINSGLKMYSFDYKSNLKNIKITEKGHFRNKTAIDSLIIYTNFAFKIAFSISVAMFLLTLMVLLYTFFIYFGKNKPIEGWTTIMLLMATGFSGFFFLTAIIIKYLSLSLELIFKKKSYIHGNIEKF